MSSAQAWTVVTGAAGFIGARLASHLLRQESETLVLVDEAMAFRTRSCCETLRLHPNRVRLMDMDEFKATWEQLPTRRIFHMGASSRTDEVRKDFLQHINTDYTRQLWDLCTRRQIPLYYASSAATYGAGDLGYSDDPALAPQLRPLNPYGWSKHRLDLQVLEAARQGPTPPHWAGWKFFNVYGPGEAHKGTQASVMHQAFGQLHRSGRLKLFRSHKEGVPDGEQKRDFVHVDDVIEVMLGFASRGLPPGIYNLGTGQARSFLDLAKAAARALEIELQVDWVDTPVALRTHYQYFTQADLSRLRAAGWQQPFRSLEQGARDHLKEWRDTDA